MRRTKWAAKIIPNPRQEREYIERDNKQSFDDKTKSTFKDIHLSLICTFL